MVHTYEVLVDVKEFAGQATSTCQNKTTRYEIDAESEAKADRMARTQARSDYPKITEYEVRVTRLLK